MFVYNKGQMYLPNYENTFGSSFLKITLPPFEQKGSSDFRYSQDYLVRKTHLKALDKDEQRCDSGNTVENTTKCITGFLQQEIGCSMGLLGGTLLYPRFIIILKLTGIESAPEKVLIKGAMIQSN